MAGCFLHCYEPLVLPKNAESKATLWEFKYSGMLRSVDWLSTYRRFEGIFEVTTAMAVKNKVFRGVTLWSLVHTLQTGSGYKGFSPGESGWVVKVTTHLYLTPKLRTNTSTPPIWHHGVYRDSIFIYFHYEKHLCFTELYVGGSVRSISDCQPRNVGAFELPVNDSLRFCAICKQGSLGLRHVSVYRH